jgi:hypothetical protein
MGAKDMQQSLNLANVVQLPQRKTGRRVRNGNPSNELVFSAMQGSNDELFPQILSLYVTQEAP